MALRFSSLARLCVSGFTLPTFDKEKALPGVYFVLKIHFKKCILPLALLSSIWWASLWLMWLFLHDSFWYSLWYSHFPLVTWTVAKTVATFSWSWMLFFYCCLAAWLVSEDKKRPTWYWTGISRHYSQLLKVLCSVVCPPFNLAKTHIFASPLGEPSGLCNAPMTTPMADAASFKWPGDYRWVSARVLGWHYHLLTPISHLSTAAFRWGVGEVMMEPEEDDVCLFFIILIYIKKETFWFTTTTTPPPKPVDITHDKEKAIDRER